MLTVGFKACQGAIAETQRGPIHGAKAQLAALEFCQLLADSVLGNPLKPKFNVYDIRIPCENPPLCYDFSQMDTFLNRADVQQALGVDKHWEEVDQMVHTYLLGDWMTNLVFKVGSILDNSDVQVLVYSGDKDWICNWRGGEAWTLSTHWKSHAEFNQQGFEMWNVDSQPAGEMRQYGNLHFLRVYEAGHMVPMDQPANALAMLDRFLHNNWNLSEGFLQLQ